MRVKIFAALVAVLSAGLALWWWLPGGEETQVQLDPYTWRPAAWVDAFGSEGTTPDSLFAQLNTAKVGLDDADAQALQLLGARVAEFQLAGQGAVDPSFQVPGRPLPRPEPECDGKVTLRSVSAAALPDVSGWAKIMVTYTGSCSKKFTKRQPGIMYVYAQKEQGQWVERQPWQVPHVDVGVPLELVSVDCADGGQLLAAGVAAAWNSLCAEARQANVPLTVREGWVSAQDQEERFSRAVDEVGLVLAREQVPFSDGMRCDSRQCTGTALVVDTDPEVVSWLSETVDCTSGTVGDGCQGGIAVSRAESFGFIRPSGTPAGYLEFALPAIGSGQGSCQPFGQSVPAQIAGVFTCRLTQAGFSVEEAQRVAAEALVVSRCASGWNPDAKLFNGEFAAAPNPQTGLTYPYSGLFGLSDEVVTSSWSAGDFNDAVAAAELAARVYVADGGWQRFYCATGGLPGVDAGPVVEAFGGPEVPAWALSWVR